ncbi:hypothetical protein HaLaN_19027 [Haematococcus lacustris]|uniref:Uncharacterized protein n=1 Tax=Haematococcus lacustris TaxID=44745 RepID=A0A699ZSF3_HAELA|nr:hypothetical protein HaLaN_19027 [Haematococcus lacustris]
MFELGCNNSGREQLVAALPAQLDAQGWGVQQLSLQLQQPGPGTWLKVTSLQQVVGPGLWGSAADLEWGGQVGEAWLLLMLPQLPGTD